MKSPKILIILISVVSAVAFLAWLFIESSKPLPGEKIDANCDNFTDFSKIENINKSDKCRAHIPDNTIVNYSTNPPTLGPHSASWITKGFYEEPRHDGNLVHSMEHGYVIVWYDCTKPVISFQLPVFKTVYAHEEEATGDVQPTNMTAGSEGLAHIKLSDMPKSFSDGSCDVLKNQIKSYIEKNNHKLIGMPRAGMDSPLILTAWGRILKLNSFKEDQIKGFVNTFRDNGPEATVEP
ncbi:hypothetical protein A3J13_00670 [Candidatus Daviesbacteria bacterium RIFCSPLOWO2_02_FULL_36_8]|uniref:DUF3105 domain-containing protein n=1 Tax=Candidatus Daviesbacteria bacterium RIFCSPLOWO2_02_FULL_36_8 TaxID=1797793 RepID=A0A1F5MFH2_9BACT|nr:MAG: hypothetical protein A3J13_00670 [Candidatus Daviesbacteria bacterium RIFCSPLOWO2_02_FULL_36_8]